MKKKQKNAKIVNQGLYNFTKCKYNIVCRGFLPGGEMKDKTTIRGIFMCSNCETKEANILIVSGSDLLRALCPWCFASIWNNEVRAELEEAINSNVNKVRYN